MNYPRPEEMTERIPSILSPGVFFVCTPAYKAAYDKAERLYTAPMKDLPEDICREVNATFDEMIDLENKGHFRRS